MELGIYSFGEMGVDPVSGQRISGEQRMQQLLEEIQLTEQVGLDVYAIGEHHRRDYLVSAPAVVLAAAAAQTEKSVCQVLLLCLVLMIRYVYFSSLLL